MKPLPPNGDQSLARALREERDAAARRLAAAERAYFDSAGRGWTKRRALLDALRDAEDAHDRAQKRLDWCRRQNALRTAGAHNTKAARHRLLRLADRDLLPI